MEPLILSRLFPAMISSYQGKFPFFTLLAILPSGRDTFVKFWCLRTQHCFLTLTGHPGPVWDFALSADCKTLITGSSDANIRMWKIKYNVSVFIF